MKKLKLEELGRLSVNEFKEAEKMPVSILLDHVRSLHNVGSVFRTADAFRAEKIYLTGITGTPPNREIHKTALGATESVAWEYAENPAAVLAKLKSEGYEILLIEQTTESIPLQRLELSDKKKYCIVFGNEVQGISEESMALGDRAIEIPQAGTKHSLNISVCVGVVLWDFYRKLGLAD
ncbi:MAG: RNA methyltransferase [Bacteroidetes bacterium]|nr:RNA methyltransferase [Bacteroidota bacterium]